MTDAPLTGAVSELGTSKAAARIRAAAIEVFAAKGYGAATTREIAASLDMSPGAVYPHYKTKESLLYAISLEGHHSVLAAITAADSPDVAAPDRLTSTVTAYVIWHADNRASARVAQYELRSLSPVHFAIIADIRRSTTKVFKRIIEAGATAGDFHPFDIEAAALAITSLGVDVSRWFPSRAYSDPRIIADRYVELTLRMVGCADRQPLDEPS
ncbi:TetR/AcrR family transcriptional regulator [Rhodococcus sp. ZPP]|uniref:TetR/AcrR family transcriptional regulator n=1 Tax=Rhodococcus sp. ZPP TaxID=2749906 RepID=UPI001AD865E5|nr:TetR/AcrR family transcriptional regulator [Rhodococcus sp. ZPP]QTJ65848.1 TetR/AcrR family transcriptional regulator [Rhodococcus sp. ZPP]